MTPRDFVLRAQSRLGLTDSELGRLCGVGRCAVSGWRSGRHAPSGAAVLAIVDELMSRLPTPVAYPERETGRVLASRGVPADGRHDNCIDGS